MNARFFALALMCAVGMAHAAAGPFGIILPAYNLTMIEKPPAALLAAASKIPIAVILGELNDAPSAKYMAGVAKMKQAGITTFHYTHTRKKSGMQCCDTFADITGRIAHCDANWPDDPVFFDNGPFPNQEAFFTKLYDYAQTEPAGSAPRTTIMNPGRSSTEEYYLEKLPHLLLMGFEGTLSTWTEVVSGGYDFHRAFNWSKYDQGRFTMIVEGVPSADAMETVIRRAAQRDLNYGHFFVTDGVQAYGRLPIFWEQEVSLVARLNTARAAAPASDQTLRDAGAKARPGGLLMGSQFKGCLVDEGQTCPPSVPADPEYGKVHTAQYSLSTVGNECKWSATHPQQEEYTLGECVGSFAYARGAKQEFRGHNLCWGNNNPAWLTKKGAFTPTQLRSILHDHVTHVMQGVRNASNHTSPLAWDVVNEACANAPNTNGSFFKPADPWYPAVPDYVDVAFLAARAADPNTLLFYNDFGAEQMGESKSENVYNMVKSMVDRNIPIDGVGLQMHTSNAGPPNEEKVAANIKRLGALGLDVHITEMDVRCADPCTAADLAKQAEVYASMLRACLSQPACKSFETWGFTDRDSWLNGKRCPTMNGKDLCHPLPFDENYQPKPAVAAMLKVLQGGV